ncbi:MAG: hypothetical protein ABUT39_00790 [Acidobacteriota bacterium]
MDASVLINLAIVDRIGLLATLEGLQFVVPGEALFEVKSPEQRTRVCAGLTAGDLREVVLDQPQELSLFARFRQRMDIGESACLALAVSRSWLFACDERGFVRSEATKLLGAEGLLNTPGLFLLALRKGCWTVDEADQAKAILEENRYRMRFKSFRELLQRLEPEKADDHRYF